MIQKTLKKVHDGTQGDSMELAAIVLFAFLLFSAPIISSGEDRGFRWLVLGPLIALCTVYLLTMMRG